MPDIEKTIVEPTFELPDLAGDLPQVADKQSFIAKPTVPD